ncbi:hypothetical protein N7495_009998 [Penicillium taxi]|uniref:uncharacterized protein n=1 Tax=Penicillium taxi TaxID=168475 RepID=UPI002544D47F|nr:uncharacterized protein N7495_009998 [Penicillium taxi]KAJ5885488.1 hypothetical protein N7495_009998 [Penicillium taxi]
MDFKIPALCKAGVVINEGPNFHVEVQDVPVPEIGPNDILIRLNFTGVCNTDIHVMQGDLGLPPMSAFGVRSAGHEGAGVVVKVGDNVKNFKLGDRAGVTPFLDTCHSCGLCWDSKETYCKDAVISGLMAPGTFQQYIAAPGRYASRIPDGVPDEVAAPIMCSGSTVYRSLLESNLRAGSWVVFPGGGGGVGTQGVQLAKALGMRPIVVDTGDAKRSLSLKLGAEAFVDFKQEDPVEAVIKIADRVGVHGVFVTASAPEVYKTAISYVGDRIGGVIMCIAVPPKDAVVLGADPGQFVFKNLTIKGTMAGSRLDTAAVLDFARRGMLQQISEVYPINRLPEAVDRLREAQVAGRIVVNFNWEESSKL